jgi:hypothetical protein
MDHMLGPKPPERCDCGSGETPQWAKDAKNIPLAKVCSKCKARKLAGFRPEVLTDPNYEAEEPIDPD